MRPAWLAALTLALHSLLAGANLRAEGEVLPRYQPVATGQVLRFSVNEGQVRNEFYRRGPVAAHWVLSGGQAPRLIVAFPAGNSGVSLDFEPTARATQWQAFESMRGVRRRLADGRVLYGVTADLTVHTDTLMVRQAVLSNIRVIRDFVLLRQVPEEIVNQLHHDASAVRWYRDRLDGKSAYELAVEVLAGRLAVSGATVRLVAPDNGRLRLRITALTGDAPLVPIELDRVVTAQAAADLRSRQVLAFLSYQEKLLAGSWRFLTYFGRDTLLSLRLLLPVLSVETLEAGLSSVLERLNSAGEVAHEEDIGEFAVLRALQERDVAAEEPIYDYKMIDDDYLLAPVMAEYLLRHPQGRSRAAGFLRRRLGPGTHGAALVGNLRHVLAGTAAYAQDPRPVNLISIKADIRVGQWRDSQEGLGAGRIPYDVNAVLVPAALQAAADLLASGLLNPYLSSRDRLLLAAAADRVGVWRGAGAHFRVHLEAGEARERVARYGQSLGVPTEGAIAQVQQGVTFHALSLDAQAVPVPILHSDAGFALLLDMPTAAELDALIQAAMRPFPAGLMTPVGLLVANPVFASPAVQQTFTDGHYHGTVIWSWQQALFAAGIERQLHRSDLPQPVRSRLRVAQKSLWQAIQATRQARTAELWSWRFQDGRYELAPFGQGRGHRDESNAAQLWSTVYLAIRPPAVGR